MAIRKKEETFPDITPCKFAGDPDDEFCAQCGGVTMEIDGKKYSCSECQAYEAGEPVDAVTPEADPVPEVKDGDAPWNDPVAPTAPESAEELPPPEDYAVLGVTTAIKAESGLSVEIKDRTGSSRWYKFTYTEERHVPAGGDVEKEKQALWNDVNRTVDQQLEDTLIYLDAK